MINLLFASQVYWFVLFLLDRGIDAVIVWKFVDKNSKKEGFETPTVQANYIPLSVVYGYVILTHDSDPK